jgi:chain length determinant protein (polysaccharide antigen chain regulator)
MQQSDQEIYPYKQDEIDLRALFNSLVARKFLIAGLTGFVTVLAILYAHNLTPIYQVSSSFTSPSTASIATINKLDLTEETKESVFSAFLTQLSSKGFQKITFVEGDYLTQFNADNAPIDDVDAFITGTVKSVKVQGPNLKNNDLTELPYTLSMQGNSPEAISEYLNSLVALANSKTIKELIKLNELKIFNRIEEVSLERDLLLEQAEKDRFSQIKRIKEEDAQKIRQINDQINRVRYKAKENRLNQMVALIDAAKLAKSLGITENNFKLFKGSGASYDLTIAIAANKDLPEWYLYGEKALLQRVELLQNRTSDDPFIPELVTLNNQLNEVQNNNLLETFETRQDDSPFIEKISSLEVEKIKLESRKVEMDGVNAMQISQVALIPKEAFKPEKRLIVLLAFIGSFMMSILLVLIMGALKPDEKRAAH